MVCSEDYYQPTCVTNSHSYGYNIGNGGGGLFDDERNVLRGVGLGDGAEGNRFGNGDQGNMLGRC